MKCNRDSRAFTVAALIAGCVPVAHCCEFNPQIKVSNGATVLQDLTYTFDKVSNVKGIGDGVYSGGASAGLSDIQYDDLHRLVSLNSVARGAKSYQYNAIGNMLLNQDYGSGDYQYGSAKPHAVTSANGKSYAYDACGNMFSAAIRR